MAIRLGRRLLLQAVGAAAVGVSFGAALEGCGRKGPAEAGGERPELNFYTWDTYIGDTTLQDFRDATGVEVQMSYFATNDELFAKLRAGNPGYDLIVPSNEFVERMAGADMLQPLDHAKIPNLKNIAPEFLDVAYDPGRKLSMPYTWLVTGLGYRKSKVDGVPDSWKWVFDSNRYTGRIAWLSEAADLVRLAAKYLGHSVNDVPLDMLPRIEAMLKAQKPFVRAFHDDNGQDMLLSHDVDIVMEYNGDIAQAMAEDDDIGFVIPREGSLLNSDCLAIPKGAPRPNNAHAFINFLLDGKVGAGIAKTILYPTPNAAAKALMPQEYRANPVVFPPASALAKCEYGRFEGAERARLYEDAFTRIRAG
jgi:spermidine/putrescine transport system substrate-binding protein